MKDNGLHTEAEKLELEKRLRDSVARSLEALIQAWQIRPQDLPADQSVRLQEAIAQAERLKEKLDALISPLQRPSQEGVVDPAE